MPCKKISAARIADVLCGYLSSADSVFVFSTDVACDTWSDWAVRNADQTRISAVALERFIAWDTFKSAYLHASSKEKNAVPSAVRKMFVSSLIEENSRAALAGSPLFRRIISPAYADSSASFTDWIAKLLPALKVWRERYDRFAGQPDFDEENLDYLLLYERYSAFLEKNNLFEQSWTELSLQETDKQFVIFYPEILEDFHEYRAIIENAANAVVVSLPEEDEPPSAAKYADSRAELRYTVLKIRALVEHGGADWTDIAVSVPDLQTYRPYIERELKNYCVPFVVRAGIPLAANGAGAIFNQIKECYASDFSFDAVRSLLQNEYVPWKGGSKDGAPTATNFRILKENLVRAGSRMRCLCPYYEGGKKIDSWEESLKGDAHSQLELNFYRNLKEDITRMCRAASFDGVRSAWFEFKAHYIEESEFSSESDKIISRCITELSALADIQHAYAAANLTLSDPFSFFLREIAAKTYRPQEKLDGISVFPYRLAAEAQFPFHFVIDSSQKNLTVQYRTFEFLSRAKREALHIDSSMEAGDVSKLFARLYASASGGKIEFSYGEQSFQGFAVAHNALKLRPDASEEERTLRAELDKADFMKAERNWFLCGGDAPSRLTLRQKSAFECWRRALPDGKTESPLSDAALQRIHATLYENRALSSRSGVSGGNAKMTLTQSDMKNFFPCPRKWIFQNALRIREDTLEADLLSPFDMGTINHAALERFMRPYRDDGVPLPCVNEAGAFDDEHAIQTRLEAVVREVIALPEMDFSRSALTKAALSSQTRAIAAGVLDFLHFMLQKREDGGFGGAKVDCLEEWFSLAREDCDWNYLGRIDCVLSDGGKNFIIDYKNSKSSVPPLSACFADDEGRISDFQIPLYVLLLSAQAQTEVSKALFLAIKDKAQSTVVNAEKKDNRSHAKTPEDYQTTLDSFFEYAKRFYEKVRSHDFTPRRSPRDIYFDARPFEDCASCSYAAVCRTVYKAAGESLARG
ncbi:MAG: PD-(D/E)XK nuclease family protein [Treponema sp.]